MLAEVNHPELSVRRQCALLGLNRSTFYYEPTGVTSEDLRLMRLIDELYTACPFYGSRKITEALTRLLAQVHAQGSPLAPDILESSDLILPHEDSSMAEVRKLLTDEGLIPG